MQIIDERLGLGQAHAAALFGRSAADRALGPKERGDARQRLLRDRGVAALRDLVEAANLLADLLITRLDKLLPWNWTPPLPEPLRPPELGS